MKVRQGGKIIDVDPFAPKVQDGPVTTEATARVEEVEPLTVPDGSVADILEWVGDDEDRRRAALAAELDATTPRKTLIAALQ